MTWALSLPAEEALARAWPRRRRWAVALTCQVMVGVAADLISAGLAALGGRGDVPRIRYLKNGVSRRLVERAVQCQ